MLALTSLLFLFFLAERFTNSFFFFFNDTATTEIYTLSLHDALPISTRPERPLRTRSTTRRSSIGSARCRWRSEEHTSELQSPCNLVCRLLLEKKKKKAGHPIRRHWEHIHTDGSETRSDRVHEAADRS